MHKQINRLLLATAFAATAGAAHAAVDVDVGVGVTIRQPGVYGRIEIGSAPPPPIVYHEPVVVVQQPVQVVRRPIYLYVPQGQTRDWKRYCGRYQACGQPVYFVREDWVRERWDHEHRGRGKGHGHAHGHKHGHGHGHGHGYKKHDD